MKKRKGNSEEKEKNLPNYNVIDPKYHSLVGENRVKYNSPMNGNCQGVAKAAILFQDPSKGPELASEENKYLVAHWNYFKDFVTFPHTQLDHTGNEYLDCFNWNWFSSHHF